MKTLLTTLIICCLNGVLHAQTWEQLNIPTTNNILSSSFISDDEGWIGTTNSGSYAIIYHTADGGINWNADTITGASGGTSFIEFINSDLGFAVVNTKVFKTTDGGDLWTQLTLPDVPYNEPYFINQDTGFISGKYAVFKTVDGGASWTPEYMEETDNTPLYRMSFLNDSIGAAVDGEESVYTTIDGGENWYCLYCGGLWNWFLGLSYNSAGELFIAGYFDDDNYVTGYILGGGEWWGEEGVNCYPYDVHFADDYRGYAAGSCGMIVNTTDGGQTWTEAAISNDEFRVVDGFNDVFVFGIDGRE